jgi:hypothetical protein
VATATVLSFLHGALGDPAKNKEEEQRRQQFSALHDLNSEKIETLFQNACRQIAKRQMRFANRAFRLECRTIILAAKV